jgi:hypothetical protein
MVDYLKSSHVSLVVGRPLSIRSLQSHHEPMKRPDDPGLSDRTRVPHRASDTLSRSVCHLKRYDTTQVDLAHLEIHIAVTKPPDLDAHATVAMPILTGPRNRNLFSHEDIS